MSMRHFKIGRGRKVRGQRGHVCPTTIVVVVAVTQHGLWRHTNLNLHTNEWVKRLNFIVCAEGMMSNQLHGVVLMVLLFDVLVFLWFSLESSRRWCLIRLGAVYGGPTLDKYCCVVTIGDDDPCCQHKIPHL
jgi:hypothetical protein